jgi:hypothetical protein
LAVIGHATALGSFPEIPFLIRSAAQSLFLETEDRGLIISVEVMALLTSTISVWDPLHPVQWYDAAWWTSPGSAMGSLEKSELVGATNNHYKQVCEVRNVTYLFLYLSAASYIYFE